MRIALAVAPYSVVQYRSGAGLGPLYLAAMLANRGHTVDVYDLTVQGQSIDGFLKSVSTGEHLVIGFSCLFTSIVPTTLDLIRRTRLARPNAHICIGGQGISFIWKEILEQAPEIDSAVCFEGEDTICDLADAICENRPLTQIPGIFARMNTEIVFTGYRQPRTALDDIPFPRRDTWSRVLEQPHFSVLTSRGCSAHCTFCCSGNFGNAYHSVPRWRPRSPDNILTELDTLVFDHGAKAISFIDDDFLGACPEGPARALSLASKLCQREYSVKWSIECRVNEVEIELFRQMKNAGLAHVFIGVESGNTGDLKLFGKGAAIQQARGAVSILRTLGLSFRIGFIMFHPLSTVNAIRENLDFLESIGVAGAQILTNRVQLYAGSPLVQYFSRRCDLDYRQFVYNYELRDRAANAYRRVLKVALEPFKQIENEVERIRFQLQTGISDVPLLRWIVADVSGFQKRLWLTELRVARALLDTINVQVCGDIYDLNSTSVQQLLGWCASEAATLEDELRTTHIQHEPISKPRLWETE